MIIFVLIFWYLAYGGGLVEMSYEIVGDGCWFKLLKLGLDMDIKILKSDDIITGLIEIELNKSEAK